MKLRALRIPILLATLLGLCLGDEDDPFAEDFVPEPEPPRPERLIDRVPASIVGRAGKDGGWSYNIAGFYVGEITEEDAEDLASTYSAFIPDSAGVRIDVKQRTCTIETSRELTKSELAYAVDDLAYQGGGMPSWLELEARDLPKSEFLDKKHFALENFPGDFPKGLAWHGLRSDESFSLPFELRQFAGGELLINPTTAYCICHSRFAIRVRSSESGVIWHDDAALFGAIRVAMTDLNSDGAHEVLLRVTDHGKESQLILKPLAENPGDSVPEGKNPEVDR
jgi:hypothetical protein